jgi:hypothetical protein
VNLRQRLTGLDANLDDLQSGVDAGSREADHIQKTVASIDRLQLGPVKSADLVRTLMRHAKELKICVNDPREALKELRAAMARLRDELSNQAVRPPPATESAGPRR